MTEDMPTVDGAMAEAERRWSSAHMLSSAGAFDSGRVAGFVAGAEWLAPTVAALEAEVGRMRIDRTADEQANARLREIVEERRSRADAAEAVIERVRGIVTDWGAGTVHRPRSPYYGRLLAALSDAAPQAVGVRLCAFDFHGECRCIRPKGHAAPHRCEHEGPDATDGREGA